MKRVLFITFLSIILLSLLSVFYNYKKYIDTPIFFATGRNGEVDLLKSCANFSGKVLGQCIKDELVVIFEKNKNKIELEKLLDMVYFEIDTFRGKNQINTFYCHDISHSIGQLAYIHTPQIEKLFSYSSLGKIKDTNCAAGYYHGIMIEYDKYESNKKEIEKVFRKLFDKYSKYIKVNNSEGNYYKDIFHGIGHIGYIRNADIKEGIDACENLTKEQDFLDICLSGVYMQKAYEEMYVDIDPDPDFCTDVGEKYRYNCFSGYRTGEKTLLRTKDMANVCNKQLYDLDFYACVRSFMYQLFTNNFAEKRIMMRDFCGEFSQNRRIICLEIYQKIEKLFSNPVTYNHELAIKNICFVAGIGQYLQCIEKLSLRERIEFVFMRPDERIFFRVGFDMGSIKLFKNIFFDRNLSRASFNEYVQQIHDQIKNNSMISDVTISKNELLKIRECNNNDRCFRNYFTDYTTVNGVESAISWIFNLENVRPRIGFNCHNSMHGIGHAALALNNFDVERTFSYTNQLMDTGDFRFCSQGYYHGIMEKYAEDVISVEDFVEKFENVCSKEKLNIYEKVQCYHGIGHSAYIHFIGDVNISIEMCKSLSKEYSYQFSCFSGVTMEALSTLDSAEIMSFKDSGDTAINFTFCESIKDKPASVACYLTTSDYMLKLFPMVNNQYDFPKVMKACSDVADNEKSLACVKAVGRLSVLKKYPDVYSVCFANFLSRTESFYCIANVANTLALLKHKDKGEEYFEVADTVCNFLDIFERSKCKTLLRYHPTSLYST